MFPLNVSLKGHREVRCGSMNIDWWDVDGSVGEAFTHKSMHFHNYIMETRLISWHSSNINSNEISFCISTDIYLQLNLENEIILSLNTYF